MTHEERMALFEQTDLYVVITESQCSCHSAIEVLDMVLSAGVLIVQLREKGADDRTLYERARLFRARTRKDGTLLIIDDRVDIALAVGADGVHLGQEDIPVKEARRIAPDLIIGASTHNLDEALAAQEAGASYVNIGPIYPTRTKEGSTGAVGPAMIDIIAPQLKVPFTVMGGIKGHNIEEVLRRGARHVAVVTAVTAERDVGAAAAELRRLILACRSPQLESCR